MHLLHTPLLYHMSYSVPLKIRLKLFESLVKKNREAIQGSNENQNLQPGIGVNITRGRVLEVSERSERASILDDEHASQRAKRAKQAASSKRQRASRNWCRCCCEASNKRSKQQAKASQSQLVFVLLARFAHSSLGSQLASLASLLED